MPSCLLLQRPTWWVQGEMLLFLLTSICQLQMDKKEHAKEVPAKMLTPFPMLSPQETGSHRIQEVPIRQGEPPTRVMTVY